MVRNAGLGIAMANAVPETVAAASLVVSSNDEGGVAEALERFVL
jgi:hydroxymethylpyrimidine pyrophosphatase-like HAD family hydrolase